MEKKKNMEGIEENRRIKDEMEKVKNQHMSEILEKDEKIIKLTREIREVEKENKEL